MKPITKILPFKDIEPTVFAKDQPQYLQLPAYVLPTGEVITRWKVTFVERLRILFQGSLWLTILTFNAPLQPVKLSVTCPLKPNNGIASSAI